MCVTYALDGNSDRCHDKHGSQGYHNTICKVIDLKGQTHKTDAADEERLQEGVGQVIFEFAPQRNG